MWKRRHYGSIRKHKGKNLGSPDELHTFEHGKMEIANIDKFTAGRITLEQAGSGRRPAVQPLAQTPSYKVQHAGYVISGQMHVVRDDGTEQDITTEVMYASPPGHDA